MRKILLIMKGLTLKGKFSKAAKLQLECEGNQPIRTYIRLSPEALIIGNIYIALISYRPLALYNHLFN